MSSSSDDPLLLLVSGLGVAVFGGGLLASGISQLRRQRRLHAGAVAPCRSLTKGSIASVAGTAYADQPAVSPLTSRPCIAWRVEIAQFQRAARGTGQWVVVRTVESRGPATFNVRDGSGSVRVSLAGADLPMSLSEFRSGAGPQLPAGARAFLDAEGIRWSDAAGGPSLVRRPTEESLPARTLSALAASLESTPSATDLRSHLTAGATTGASLRLQELVFEPGPVYAQGLVEDSREGGLQLAPAADGKVIVSREPLAVAGDAMRRRGVQSSLAGVLALIGGVGLMWFALRGAL